MVVEGGGSWASEMENWAWSENLQAIAILDEAGCWADHLQTNRSTTPYRYMMISLNMQLYVLLRCIQYIDNWAQLSCIDLLRYTRPSQVLLEPNLQFKVRAWSCLEDQYQKRVSELVYMYIYRNSINLNLHFHFYPTPILDPLQDSSVWAIGGTVPLALPFWNHPEIIIRYGT